MTVDRRAFTPAHIDPDYPVPVGRYTTVPTERMASLLAELCGRGEAVLEIGTGSGYQAAMLAERFRLVFTVEVDPQMVELSAAFLRGYSNVFQICEDGARYDPEAEFDAVLITFACRGAATVWKKALKEGGRLVIPLKLPGWQTCKVSVFEKRDGVLEYVESNSYAPFVEGDFEGEDTQEWPA